jgi:hypothetical protein
MHKVMSLEPAIRKGVRAEVFSTLAEYASGGEHGPIRVGLLFLKICDRLARAGIIENRPHGQEFEKLKYSYPSVSFPNFNVPSVIANLIRQVLWELYTERVLAPAPQPREILDLNLNKAPLTPLALYLDLDYVMLTPYGVDMLIDSKNRIQVHDPDRYLANFWGASPVPDPEMMRYLSECISVFRGGHLLASVVLLGIASERLIEVLAESLRDALGDSTGTTWFQNTYNNKRDISARFKALSGKLMGEYGEALNRQKLKEAFQGVVTLTFEEIRLARNDIAHPTDRQFTWNEVSGFLHSFVQYFIYVNRMIAFLSSNPRRK